jgi:dTDP-glucose 4,6-dehydratase
MRVLITGGAGFIGSNFVRARLVLGDEVTVLDKLTYAGHLENLDGVMGDVRFVEGDICEADQVARVMDVDCVVNFAAESHVDRSILGAAEFVRTNVLGVQVLLDAARAAGVERFCQVSTDEVYGSAPAEVSFTEADPLVPSSPYAASKASADLLCQSYHRTHGLPVLITRCTNNYGPYQYPEKLIPLFLLRALSDEALPLYGDGQQERDWLHVADHCDAIGRVIERGRSGAIYNIGAGNRVSNREVVAALLEAVDKPWSLVQHVDDRLAHDRRYAVDTTKIQGELGWRPTIHLDEGLSRTVAWFRDHQSWLLSVTGPEFDGYVKGLYGERLG